MAQIGSTWVSVAPNASGFGQALSQQIGQETAGFGAQGTGIGSKFGAGLAGAAKKGIQVTGQALLTVGKIAVGVGASILGAIAGVAIKGGWDRAMSLDATHDKLKALGYDEKKITSLMQSATDAVDDTAHSLDQAAKVGQMFGAAGVQLGDDMDRALRNTSNLATAFGMNMEDVGQILNKVAVSPRNMGMAIKQLGMQGVPVMSMLAKSMGKTTDEIQKMVSTGKISFADLQDAIENSLGTDLVTSESFASRIAIVRAQLSRLGAAFISPALSAFKPVLVALKPAIKSVTSALQPFIDAMQNKLAIIVPKITDKIEKLTDKITAWGDSMKGTSADGANTTMDLSKFKSKIVGLLPFIGLLGGGLGTILSKVPLVGALFSGLTGPVGLVIGLFSMLTIGGGDASGMFDTIISKIPQLADSAAKWVSRMADNLVEVIPKMAQTVVDGLPVMGDAAAKLWGSITDAIPKVAKELLKQLPKFIETAVTFLKQHADDILQGGLSLLHGLVDAVTESLPSVTTALTDLLGFLVQFISDHASDILQAGVDMLMALVDSIGVASKPLADKAPDLISKLAGALDRCVPIILDGLTKLLKSAFEKLPENFPSMLTFGPKLAIMIVWELLKGAPEIGRAGFELIGALLKGIWDASVGIGEWFAQLPAKIKEWVGNWTNVLAGKAVELLSPLASDIANAWTGTVVPMFKDWKGKIVDAVGNLGSVLEGAGKQLIDGFVNGIKSMFTNVKDTLGSLTSKLFSWKGPPTRDAVLLEEAGHLVMGGFITGLRDMFPKVKGALQSITADLQDVADANTPSITINAGLASIKPANVTDLAMAVAGQAQMALTTSATLSALSAPIQIDRGTSDTDALLRHIAVGLDSWPTAEELHLLSQILIGVKSDRNVTRKRAIV